MDITNHILVCKDLDVASSFVEQNYNKYNLKVFAPEDFLLDDAKAVVKEAYIAESDLKVIALISRSYNIYAQNSLLKIFEEPPRNIAFIICVPSKTILLPTIRSRMGIKTIKVDEDSVKTGIDFKRLDIGSISNFLEDKKNLEKEKTKKFLQAILKEAIEQGLKFTTEEMDMFHKYLHLSELNSRSYNLLLSALLLVLNRKNR
ncbi:MAG: DNA polymerase III subunit delta' [Campylobacteraceae bacterium]